MPQKINIDQVAELARLNLKFGERAKLAADLERILTYVDQLQGINTDHVTPTSHTLALENVFRPDAVVPSKIRDAVLQHAPKSEGAYFKVPKVIGDVS
ncbi:MAG: asparaginyl/glutamyl-tRNA amidotransferase subunit C [Omnitrophica bacterium RIFCSPHIGHO2_02_FULL_49_9]|nr:MAG: asparaginyl/glutamyl-tRNA amidotransferase subunit C [Omnitrophica bacterium RIFCSPHIGHO2_02_FULL_49_9]